MSSDSHNRRRALIDRRALIVAGLTGGIGFASTRAFAQSGSSATPVASPAASPIVEPTPPPPALPDASPGSPLPLTVIREQRPVESTAPFTGGDLRLFVQGSDLVNFSPVTFRQDFQVACSLYDPLIWLDDVTCEPQPWLAESWEWSTDGRELTFVIRSDVLWHDATPLTAR